MPNGFRSATSRRALRYRLTLLLHGCTRPLSVAEMVEHLRRVGHPAPDPAHKSVADSLRWEIGHGRVRRVARGRYSAGHVDRRTAWWMRRQLDMWESVERVSESPARAASQSEADSHPVPTWLAAIRPTAPDAGAVERTSVRGARIVSVGSDEVDRHYLIVSGPAASGKTLVARGLSDELGWPIFAKDTIKAALMSVLPVADVDDARRLGRAAVEVLLAVAAEVTGGAVLEAVWRRDQGRDEVSSLRGAVVEVFCRCDRPTLEARYAARRRSAGYVPEHQDPAELWSPETFEPLAGGWSVIEVDTAGEVDPVALADKVRQAAR